MAESKKQTEKTTRPASTGTAPARSWQSIRNTVKAEIRDAAETASLRMKLSRAEREKKDLLRQLGSVSYERLRPKRTTVPSELDDRAEALAARIDEKTQEIVGLRITLKMRKI